ncbi:Stk1 family PASTA domain-containing Ser/Thr kinase [Demequina lignilytica]|uniref:non-specific serine/threonine protein kinase n=1 Tax=Demequina lignilytica TaxID=3051663 RepID=A0AB35MEH1_9MICO|nr:Stk1 family PASTA domain-containing Ser/Thr kinase [Demequina sp. SYSU T0a273]MDN4482149.1 Stk1 family PASTA domain-containing Ser/Thr kinase [Demequina sp. SYSU T0a273]
MSDTLTDPLLGRVIDGRYEVRERVAAGGMATVYLAFDRHLEREIALKVMHPHLEVDPRSREFVARFRREAKAAARLTHPGVVRVYDQGTDQELSYLTMEFVEGENLRERMAHEGPLALGDALTTAEHVLDALAAAHRQGLVHQDVKPENVLIDTDGRPRVADFGLARAVTEVTSSTTGTILGTVAYLGPELISNGISDARTDVYAVGVLLYEMITGRQPYTGDTAIDVATQHVHHDMPAPSESVPWLPPEIDDLVASLTSRDPAHRPADAAEALERLRATRDLLDDPTLDRRADPPSGQIPAVGDDDATTVLEAAPVGATVALPIGLGHPFPAVGAEVVPDLPDDDPEAEEPRRADRRAGWWIAAILVAVLVIGGGSLWWYNSIGPGAYTTVPPVANETEDNARTFLESAGLEAEVEYVYDDDVLDGFVIGTDPSAQQRVLGGSTVTVFVSQGPEMFTVPSVVGSSETDARAALAEIGFTIGEVTSTSSDTVPSGEVMSVSPAEGETVRHDEPVDMVVSSGPAPITVPDVSGMKQDDAVALLEDDYALRVTVETGRTEDVKTGEVYAQSLDAGSEARRTDAITITVSEGKPLIEVGDYVGLAVDEAEAAAKDDGLKVSLYPVWPWSSKTSVVDQSIFPGTAVEKNSTITLRYN